MDWRAVSFDWNQVRSFLATVEEGSFSAAARVLGLTQPTLGRLAALLLSGTEADWAFKKGAIWWFSRRVREGDDQTVLRAVMGADLL